MESPLKNVISAIGNIQRDRLPVEDPELQFAGEEAAATLPNIYWFEF